MKTVILSKAASKALAKIPANEAEKIDDKIKQLALDDGSLANNVTRLQGTTAFRLRVGDWRVIYDDDGMTLSITAIGARGSVY
ncbi:type II toxin-antitoxin system RelE/ParE family toxin [Sphingorhabdus soli]|uniref:Type II toxin-antitoxin system RelE/ParE family toxin n=1 Tax=Flavisphingopyxis soli TaxID=2601267 RepID=A0A5C6ULU2_9SPHN|nr:type II toxin-antitoxin system RelE/ParE family toxin [Sphingorhabdus soli]TXC73947.1 type II toxin-antitoxin system RelE/ParE family toxin [Sphingorhabdus soli]